MNPSPLTPRQAEVYRWIFDQTCRHGFQPSFRDIKAEFGMQSHNGVKCHLAALAAKGWIGPVTRETREGFFARALVFRFTPEGEPFEGFCPVVPEGTAS